MGMSESWGELVLPIVITFVKSYTIFASMVCPKSITNILPITFLKTEINSPSRNIKDLHFAWNVGHQASR